VNTAPCDALITLSLKPNTDSFRVTTASKPNALAVLTIVPRFPGLLTESRTMILFAFVRS